MRTDKPIRILSGIGITAAIAIVSMYSGRVISLPKDGFFPGSFITHSLMLLLSLAVIGLGFRGRFSEFGLTVANYRFRSKILLWVLPTGILSSLALLAPEAGDSPGFLGDMTKLQLVVFVWFYASLCEEVLTRGLLQTLLSANDSSGTRNRIFTMPVVVSGLVFGAMHLVLIGPLGKMAVVPIILTTLLGFLAAHYREKTGSLIPAFIVHALFNVGGMLPGWIHGWLIG